MSPEPSGPVFEPPPPARPRRLPRWVAPVVFLLLVAVIVLLGLLAVSIWERRQEARETFVYVTPIAQWEPDNAVWGRNFPREYQSYLQTRVSVPQRVTKYGGSMPRSYLEQDPNLVILWTGYAFSKDYNEPRGHYYSVGDVTRTPRIRLNPQAAWATCFTCKSTDVPRLMASKGVEEFYHSRFLSMEDRPAVDAFYAGQAVQADPDKVSHPIGCQDCHDPKTMNLRITRPALRDAMAARGVDIDQATHQEMRTLVCAQCHVEYYFGTTAQHPRDKFFLRFPWDGGLTVEPMLDYYNDTQRFDPEHYGEGGFADFTNAVSGTRMLKAQHPDYELYTTGIHAYRNVSRADCHMPYRTEGGVKFTDHHVQSPLLNISNSCAVCHRWSEEEILQRVYAIQDKVWQAKLQAERALVAAHFDVAAAGQAGFAAAQLAPARRLLREAQFRWDYIRSSNGMGFHSPQESMRVLMDSANQAQQVRLLAARLLGQKGIFQEPSYPDISTREKAAAIMHAFEASTQPSQAIRPGQSGWLLPAGQ